MPKPSAIVVLESEAEFLHGIGAAVALAGLVYHGLKRHWGYFTIAVFITGFHSIAAWNHHKEREAQDVFTRPRGLPG